MKIKTSTGLYVESFAALANGHYPFEIWHDGELEAEGIAKQGGGGWMQLTYLRYGIKRQTSQKGHVNDQPESLAEAIAKGWVWLMGIVSLATRHADEIKKFKPDSGMVPVLSYPTRNDYHRIAGTPMPGYLQWEDHCTLTKELARIAESDGIRIVEVPAFADEFENWLKVNKLKNTSDVRARYAAEHAPRPGAPVGNKNAQKRDQPLAGIVHFRCQRIEKAAWVRAARQEGLSLSAWLTKVANAAADELPE